MTDDVDVALSKLSNQIAALQADVRALGRPGTLPPADDAEAVPPGAHAWLGTFEVPTRRRFELPRVLLEALFLAAVAAAAAFAELDPVGIAGVMVGAWVLVALIEWAASRAERAPELPLYVPARDEAPHADPSWYAPPVELTLLEGANDGNVTAVTRLPPLAVDPEATVEQRPDR